MFINCPSREGFRYVVTFVDHATKMLWSYPMKKRSEFSKVFLDLIDVKLHALEVKIKHYHADGGKELISNTVISKLQKEGSRYTWTPADTPELNSTSERKWRTLGEMCLSMLLRSGLPTDFWWDAYEAATYIAIRLPTKTVKGYLTPYECVHGEIPDLSHLRIWGCKTYLKMPRNYARKDFRDKAFSGYMIGYSAEGAIGYKIFVPEFKEVIVGVNCTFNEIIPSYAEEYFNEINKLKFETAKDESTVVEFQHLVGERYQDDENSFEYENTRVVEFKGHIVAYRAPVLENNQLGLEEKAPIHVADVVKMVEETWFHQSQVATSRDTTLKKKDHGGVILTTHDASEKMSGTASTNESDSSEAGGHQNQCRVKFDVGRTATTSEPDSWRVKQARHHAVRTESVASKDSKAPRKGTILSGGGRRAERTISEQQEPACLDGVSRSADGPCLVARRVYRVPTSELQTREIGVMGDSIVLSAEPRRDRNASSSRNSEKDKAVGRESTVRGTTSEPRSRDRVDSDTMNNISHSTEIQERFVLGEADLLEADTNKWRRAVSNIDTSPTLNRQEVFVSHKWGKAADKASKAEEKQSAKRIVQPRQVTNVKSMGNVYSATSNDESDAKENSDEMTAVNLSKSHKRSLDDQQRTYVPEVKTKETAPASFDEAAKLSEWRKSNKS